jgi:hypothetical protein
VYRTRYFILILCLLRFFVANLFHFSSADGAIAAQVESRFRATVVVSIIGIFGASVAFDYALDHEPSTTAAAVSDAALIAAEPAAIPVAGDGECQ